MSRDPYFLHVDERVKEILGKTVIPDTAIFSYSFDDGYERLFYRESRDRGELIFQGSYHPDGICVGQALCTYCGRVL